MRVSFKKSINELELYVDTELLKIFKVPNNCLYFSTMDTDPAGI